MSYCVYLRKSRADIEMEKKGRFETLGRHRAILLKYAADNGFAVSKIREEIVSGESVSNRPEMLALLREVEQGKYLGVLVMDVDRLGRGNMQEQGMILETFKCSGTRIITPRKTYDLENEFDEEYSEFAAFMARKELKLINRRLQQGRIKSVEEGNYIAPLPPYGYVIHKSGRKRKLVPDPEQAPIVRLIFELYVNGCIGAKRISLRLNEMDVKTYTGKRWDGNAVLNILKNPVYTGKLVWGSKKSGASPARGVRTGAELENAHEAIVSRELYDKASSRLKQGRHSAHGPKTVNPFAGLILCKGCGSPMVYRQYTGKSARLLCYRNCGEKSAKFSAVEERILSAVTRLLSVHENLGAGLLQKPESTPSAQYAAILARCENRLRTALNQKNRLYDLLERSVYDTETFKERMAKLNIDIERITQGIEAARKNIGLAAAEPINAAHNDFNGIMEIYEALDAHGKNCLLKTIIEKIEYSKPKALQSADFELTIFARI